MTLEEIFNDPEKYPDNVRIKRPCHKSSSPIHWVKQLIEWTNYDKNYPHARINFSEKTIQCLTADDWEVFDG